MFLYFFSYLKKTCCIDKETFFIVNINSSVSEQLVTWLMKCWTKVSIEFIFIMALLEIYFQLGVSFFSFGLQAFKFDGSSREFVREDEKAIVGSSLYRKGMFEFLKFSQKGKGFRIFSQ